MSFGIKLDAIGPGFADGDFHQINCAGSLVQPPDEITPLCGKPDMARVIEYQCVWILERFIWHCKSHHFAGIGVHSADISLSVSRNPDRRVTVYYKVVRAGSWRKVLAREFKAFRIKMSDIVAALTDQPNTAVGGNVRVSWPRIRPGNDPL